MTPKAGRKYLHFKGSTYTVIDLAKHSETQETMVIYRNAQGEIFVRPLTSWNKPTPDGKERFTLIN